MPPWCEPTETGLSAISRCLVQAISLPVIMGVLSWAVSAAVCLGGFVIIFQPPTWPGEWLLPTILATVRAVQAAYTAGFTGSLPTEPADTINIWTFLPCSLVLFIGRHFLLVPAVKVPKAAAVAQAQAAEIPRAMLHPCDTRGVCTVR